MSTLSILALILVAVMVGVLGILSWRADRDREQRRVDDICDGIEREPVCIDRRLYRAPLGRAFGEVVDWKLPSVPTEPLEDSDD